MPPKTKKAADAVTSADSPTAGEMNADPAADSAALPTDRPAESQPTAGNPETDTAPPSEDDDVETKETDVIEFFGPGKEVTIRRLTAEDWTRLGFEGLEEVDWRKENDWKVPVEHFRGNIPKIREFFSSQPDFRIVQAQVPVDTEA
jgi:hypothetical protein